MFPGYTGACAALYRSSHGITGASTLNKEVIASARFGWFENSAARLLIVRMTGTAAGLKNG